MDTWYMGNRIYEHFMQSLFMYEVIGYALFTCNRLRNEIWNTKYVCLVECTVFSFLAIQHLFIILFPWYFLFTWTFWMFLFGLCSSEIQYLLHWICLISIGLHLGKPYIFHSFCPIKMNFVNLKLHFFFLTLHSICTAVWLHFLTSTSMIPFRCFSFSQIFLFRLHLFI